MPSRGRESAESHIHPLRPSVSVNTATPLTEMDDSGWPAGGMELVLKDVRKNIEKGLATAKEEWEVALKRGDNWKPLEQVQ